MNKEQDWQREAFGYLTDKGWEDWEKEFEERFGDLHGISDDLKSFISSLLSAQKKEIVEDLEEAKLNIEATDFISALDEIINKLTH